jgi:flavorubredoxin/NADPH-dependent 2,4-dienoyl-CoA reductase/sulfur reductase-like enzyme
MTQLQTSTEKLAEGIYWIGALDADLEVFDIVMETKYGTTYNAYVVNTDEGAVLVETVKECYFDSYIAKLKSIIGDIYRVKYLITNHTEPDHSGSISKMIELLPNLQVIGSRTAITYLKDIVNVPFNYRTAEDLEALKFGGKTFEFISVPFLHWPDSMYTYLKEDKFLFTCDSFGAHYSPKGSILISKMGKDEEESYQDALLYYYTAIFGPFKSYMLKAYEKIKDLDIEVICEGHGPVLDSRCWEIVETYIKYSKLPEKGKKKKVVMVYASAYGYTTEIANDIISGFESVCKDAELKKFEVNIQNYAGQKGIIMDEILTADGVILGTNTINGDAVPPIWDIALSMNPIVHGGKILTAFGSYGWGGEGVDNIIDRMNQLRGHVLDGFKIKFRPSPKELKDANAFGALFGKCVLSGTVPAKPKPKAVSATNWQELNPKGKIVLWRCIICGEVYEGVSPPLKCPACGVGEELFELYTVEEITNVSTDPIKVVVIGSGVAAVSAIDTVRERNSAAQITMITEDDRMPYYRPIIVQELVRKINDEEFFIRKKQWPRTSNVDVKLNTKVTKIDKDAKKVITDNGEHAYDKLIIATGATPFIPPLCADGMDHVFAIRTAADVEQLKEKCKTAKKVVIIGGGILGLENAYVLKQIGLDVTVTEVENRLMPRQLDIVSSHILQEKVKEFGINLVLNAKCKVICENDKIKAVNINGEEHECDIVIVNTGTRANSQIAKEAGIECCRGIKVNEKMQTNIPDIYAAGDCAFLYEMNQGLWAPALEMGKTAGANVCGDEKTFAFAIEPVSFLVSNCELTAIGTPPPTKEGYNVISQNDSVTGKSFTLYFREGRLVYAVAFNMQNKVAALISAVRGRKSESEILPALF